MAHWKGCPAEGVRVDHGLNVAGTRTVRYAFRYCACCGCRLPVEGAS